MSLSGTPHEPDRGSSPAGRLRVDLVLNGSRVEDVMPSRAIRTARLVWRGGRGDIVEVSGPYSSVVASGPISLSIDVSGDPHAVRMFLSELSHVYPQLPDNYSI